MNEFLTVSGKRLGLKSPSHKPALKLARYLTGVVPVHPLTSDNLSRVPDWAMYGNDVYGDCGPAAVANSLKSISIYSGGPEITVSQTDVFDLYRRSGNPHFDPRTGRGDEGVIMQEMLEALLAGGIGGHKPLAFAQIDAKDVDTLRAAVSLFGIVLFGVTLQEAQQSQPTLWDYRRSRLWGGHAVMAGSYTSQDGRGARDVGIVSWAEVIGTTDEFLRRQLDEAWVVVWPQHLEHPDFQRGINLDLLAADYEALTGRPFPMPVDPAPVNPTPINPAPVDPEPEPGSTGKSWEEARRFLLDTARQLEHFAG